MIIIIIIALFDQPAKHALKSLRNCHERENPQSINH